MPRVSISDSNKHFEVNEGDVIFDSLALQGERLQHGCLSGSCGACRIEVLAGAENLHPAGFVEQNTIEAIKLELEQIHGPEASNKKIRLSCRAKIFGDITIKQIK
jgi:ferredoxin